MDEETLTQSKVHQNAEEQQKEKLKYYSLRANQQQEEETKEKQFFQMSLIEIYQRLSQTLVQILTELTEIIQNAQKEGTYPSMQEVVTIFVQGDRMIYVGLILLFISIMVYFVDLT